MIQGKNKVYDAKQQRRTVHSTRFDATKVKKVKET